MQDDPGPPAGNAKAPAPTRADPPSPAPADQPTPTAPMTGHAATDTAADAADATGRIRATRRMPEPDSLGG